MKIQLNLQSTDHGYRPTNFFFPNSSHPLTCLFEVSKLNPWPLQRQSDQKTSSPIRFWNQSGFAELKWGSLKCPSQSLQDLPSFYSTDVFGSTNPVFDFRHFGAACSCTRLQRPRSNRERVVYQLNTGSALKLQLFLKNVDFDDCLQESGEKATHDNLHKSLHDRWICLKLRQNKINVLNQPQLRPNKEWTLERDGTFLSRSNK